MPVLLLASVVLAASVVDCNRCFVNGFVLGPTVVPLPIISERRKSMWLQEPACLFSSKRVNGNGSRNEDDYQGEDRYYYGRSTRYARGSKAEGGLKRMEEYLDNYGYDEYYDDYDDGEQVDDWDARKGNAKQYDARNHRSSRSAYIDQYDDEHDVEFDHEYESEPDVDAGNFWSNPSSGIGRYSPTQRRRPKPPSERDLSQEQLRPSSPRNRRTSFRSSALQVPPIISELYNRLFWYGFDPTESQGVGDNTVFGGTKGKFNGLDLLREVDPLVPRPPERRVARRLPHSRRESRYGDDDYDDFYGAGTYDLDDDDEDNQDDFNTPTPAPSDRATPPTDKPILKNDLGARKPSRPRQSKANTNDYVDNGDDLYRDDAYSRGSSTKDDYAKRNGREKNQGKSESWHDDDDDFEAGDDSVNNYQSRKRRDDYDDRRSRRRTRRNEASSEWSPFNVLDTFFGVNREEMRYQAQQYDNKMGLNSWGDGQSSSDRRRPGYAYRYDRAEDDDTPPVVDYEAVAVPVQGANFESKTPQATTAASDAEMTSLSQRVQEPSWEERSMAVERVPPAYVAAWGPSGDLGMDARTKAIGDALEDIQTAKMRLAQRKKKESLAEEDMTILKVDAELQRRRISEHMQGARMARERLRQIELEIEDASRALRRARTQTQLACDRLEELEERHWALLRLYIPDQAGKQVDEALEEFWQLEPAARLDGFAPAASTNFSERIQTPTNAQAQQSQGSRNSGEPNLNTDQI